MVDDKISFTKRITSRVSSFFGRGEAVEKSSVGRGGLGFRNIPLPFNSYVQTVGSNEKTPLYRWSYSWVMDLFYGSDLLRLIVKSINDEIFKNGVSVTPRFVRKCTNTDCAYELFEELEECPICGSRTRKPNLIEKGRLEAFMRKRNRFDEAFVNILKIIDIDVDIFDNGFLLFTKSYLYSEDGKIIGADLDDLVRLSPDKVKLVISNYGMGRGDTGTYLYVCPEHREKIIIKAERDDETRCTVCGKEVLRCWYASNPSGSAGSGASGQNIYFGKDEIFHVKRWTSTEGYGVSPVYTVWRKILTLIKMDDYTLEAYSLQRSPRSFLVMRGKFDNVVQAWEYLMQKARENPNMVYPLIVEGTDVGARRVVEQVSMDLKPDEMQMMQMVELFRTHVGLMYGVQPLFTQGARKGEGMSNEGLSVTVTNRTIQESQRVWNSVLEWIAKTLNASDYSYKLNPNEVEDEMRKMEMNRTAIEIAQGMSELGFDATMVVDKNGIINFTYKKMKPSAVTDMGGGNVGTGGEPDMLPPVDEEPSGEEQEGGGEEDNA